MAGFVSWLLATISPSEPPKRLNKYNIPLPECCHATLTAETIDNRPVFVVGDVHGCLEELEELLQLAKDEHENPFVVFVGDMINKGPYNIEVLRLVEQMVERGQAAAVRGNHEESILRELWSLSDTDRYALPERYNWLRQLTSKDFTFLQDLPYTISIPSLGTLIVHAGLVPGVHMLRQSLESLTHMRNIIQEEYFEGRGLVGTSKLDKGDPWGSLWPGPEHVYFGHDARRSLQRWPKATGLDTGCLYGKLLTGVFVGEEPKFLTVEAKKIYVEP
ncbi:bis(5'-nucleosyl)-tetraphosphatase PrpE [asymmetrical]-like isoform X2 [Littorina saxatilis]|uniref:bis(5'-nucleosyl)-tetraphosphatase PrpE [asymmetrical]-like isoform X2 n=1 Tax=Littorina saxatilis TaxID=31220 RepID=UPI0038B4CF09